MKNLLTTQLRTLSHYDIKLIAITQREFHAKNDPLWCEGRRFPYVLQRNGRRTWLCLRYLINEKWNPPSLSKNAVALLNYIIDIAEQAGIVF